MTQGEPKEFDRQAAVDRHMEALAAEVKVNPARIIPRTNGDFIREAQAALEPTEQERELVLDAGWMPNFNMAAAQAAERKTRTRRDDRRRRTRVRRAHGGAGA